MIKYTVEYSVEQGCFHIERLKLTLERNLMDMFDGNSNDYKVIAICDDYDEANNFVKNCKKAMENIKEWVWSDMNKMIQNQIDKINALRKEYYQSKSYYRRNDLQKQIKEEVKQLNIARGYVEGFRWTKNK